jgi:hypothetical protein
VGRDREDLRREDRLAREGKPVPFRLASTFKQRCFYLLAGLLVLLACLPFVQSVVGAVLVNFLSAFVIVATVVAAGRSRVALVLAAVLAAPTLLFQSVGLAAEDRRLLALSFGSGAALYLVAVVYLLRYVLRREVLTLDKLYGAAATYLLLGVAWAYLYAILQHLEPGSFAFGGAPADVNLRELIYFSFTALTTTGFGDITPVHAIARTLTMFEQLAGVLYVAILIARLAGSYPPPEQER